MIHPSAQVHPEAKLDPSVEVGPWCIVGRNVVIGRGTKLISHVVVDGHTQIGEDPARRLIARRLLVCPFRQRHCPVGANGPHAHGGPALAHRSCRRTGAGHGCDALPHCGVGPSVHGLNSCDS